jgi:hypothetical protein
MSQSRAMSAMEALINVLVGWCTAFALQVMLFPALDLHASFGQHLSISLVFTVVSFARSYVLRRAFARVT